MRLWREGALVTDLHVSRKIPGTWRTWFFSRVCRAPWPALESKEREPRGEAASASPQAPPRSIPKLRQLAPVFSFNAGIPFFLPNQSLGRLPVPETVVSTRGTVWISPHWEQLVIDQELAKELSCGICLQLLVKPRQCTNGHLFCNECIVASLEKRPECPTCRCHMSGAENIARYLQPY